LVFALSFVLFVAFAVVTMQENEQRFGVLLFNLGGPEKLADVRPFLYNLFADPDIIRLPWRAMQKPLAWIISTQRYRKSQGYYRKIGGGSPLRKITDQQAQALEAELAGRGVKVRTYIGMRYWNPFIEDAIAEIRRDRITDLIVLPLYPQFSVSTTGSSLNRMKEILRANSGGSPKLSVIREWHRDPQYIRVLARSIEEELAALPDQDPAKTHILFSAHSVPVSYIEKGDPYLDQTRRTVELTVEQLGGSRPHSLSFQSKVGPVKWLEPSTDQAIRKLSSEGWSQLLLVPVSFVSEHIETLYELDILYRDVAKEVGVAHYRRVPAFDCRTDFVQMLANLVQAEMQSEKDR
jgi:ferrochelatase